MADLADAEQFSHSLETQASIYFTISPSQRDLTYQNWWRALGATGFENVTPVSGRIRPITDEQLLKSLQYVLGKPDASFREGQLEACRHVANSKTENAMVGLDCGVGKSTTFTVPLYAKWRYQKINGVTMVICPHSIALKQHYATAVKELKNTDISISILTAGDIKQDFTAMDMEQSNLLFITLDAWFRITTDKLNIILEMRKKRGVSHIIFDEYHMLYEEHSIRKTKYLSTRHLLSTGATITLLTATLPNPFRRPVMQFLDIEDSAVEIGMGTCTHPDIEVNVHVVKQRMLDDEAAKRVSVRLKSHPNGTIHCISYFKADAEKISTTLDKEYGIPHTLLTGESDGAVYDKVAKDHRAAKIKVLVSTFGTALDGPKVNYVCIAGGAWSMNSLVQNFGRIRPQSQGREAVVDVLYASDLQPDFWAELVLEAKQSCIELKNDKNALVVREEDFFEHCSVIGVKNFMRKKGCRLVNAYLAYGGTENSCGRCDNCRQTCAHTAASHRRMQALNKAENDRIQCRRVFQALMSACVICKRANCDGVDETKCNNARASCFCCGWQGYGHPAKNCEAKESKYTPKGYCLTRMAQTPD